jgi:hypothetical protein
MTKDSMVEELLDCYLSWREECAALDAAWDRWVHATKEDRPFAFAAYAAQLDLEEQAARCHETSFASATAAFEGEPLALAATAQDS